MITAERLQEEHDSDFGGRPQRIQRLRGAFQAHCELSPPRSVAAIDEWYSAHKSTITERLNEHLDDGGED